MRSYKYVAEDYDRDYLDLGITAVRGETYTLPHKPKDGHWETVEATEPEAADDEKKPASRK